MNLHLLLDQRVETYNQVSFIAQDPISVPHQFKHQPDIEIAAFFSALFAWGNRTTIINKANQLMQLMNLAPHQFVLQAEANDLRRLAAFKHRTFNSDDLYFFIDFFKYHYRHHSSLEAAFIPPLTNQTTTVEAALNYFRSYVFSRAHLPRTRKHISSPAQNSACKRLNMFLRWMVRNQGPVDFGIWKRIKPADLICPMDVHVSRVAQKLGLITGPQVNWKTAIQLTNQLRRLNPADPVRYDFALFALGAIEKF